jgi:hypothetical protein
MLTRRQFMHAAPLASAGLLGLPGCAPGTSSNGSYEQAVLETWRNAKGRLQEPAALLQELVRFATLAPSSHNTQCWQFQIEERAISIRPDMSRRCPAVDPDNHHLFVSLGCATENLALTARAHGLMASVTSQFAGGSTPDGEIRIALEPTKATSSALSEAILHRQSTRAEYDGKALTNDELRLLELAGTGDGVRVLMLTERGAMERVLDFVAQGNTAQMKDPAFVAELKSWIRFNGAEAVRKGDGLYTSTTGNPSLPRWLGSPLFDIFFNASDENDKYARQIRSSAGIAVFASEANDRAHWIEAGRCCERFALQATALGVRSAFINQPVEVAALRPQFAQAMGFTTQRPDIVMRFGHGPQMTRSLRRSVQAVLVPA